MNNRGIRSIFAIEAHLTGAIQPLASNENRTVVRRINKPEGLLPTPAIRYSSFKGLSIPVNKHALLTITSVALKEIRIDRFIPCQEIAET